MSPYFCEIGRHSIELVSYYFKIFNINIFSNVLGNKLKPKCGVHEYRCPGTWQCIKVEYVCDGHNDCIDGSDEPQDSCSKSTLLKLFWKQRRQKQSVYLL